MCKYVSEFVSDYDKKWTQKTYSYFCYFILYSFLGYKSGKNSRSGYQHTLNKQLKILIVRSVFC